MSRTASHSPRARRRGALLAGGAALAIAGGLLAAPPNITPASAAFAEMLENFDGAAAPDEGPGGWTVERKNVDGMQPGWQGWSFHSTADIVSKWDGGGDRSSFTKGQGLVAVVHSDKNAPTDGTFDSTLWSPRFALTSGTRAVAVDFDSHYKQGQTPQNAKLVVRFDNTDPKVVQEFQTKRLNEAEKFTVDVPYGVKSVQVGWSYLESKDNWYWMIDNVRIAETEQPPSVPRLDSDGNPFTTAGSVLPIKLTGLRFGQRLTATVGSGDAAQNISLLSASPEGRTSFDLRVPANQAPGVIPVKISGAGATTLEFSVTVLPDGSATYDSTEQQLWHNGFESAEATAWTTKGEGNWELLSRPASLEKYGTDRRQAFTRASGTMAVAEAGSGFTGSIISPSVPVTDVAGQYVELRLDSHLLKRGTGTASAKITAIYNDGARTSFPVLGAKTRESEQLRLPFLIPNGAKNVKFEFAYTAPEGTGSWRIDDVELVRPLAPLAPASQPSAVVDVFSDVQGSTNQLKNMVLPGLRALQPAAKTIVSNGDLTANGTESQYNGYLSAYNAGAGDQYSTKISTIGNHEFFGNDGSENHITRFLDRTNMRELAVLGTDPSRSGLWGEVLVDGELPVLWIGSEFFNYAVQGGSGPFVKMSDQQFTWLQDRLTHWRAQNKPVVLFSHHVFANSNSGTYSNFYRSDFGADTARLQALLTQNPNVTILTSHTHWSPTLADWSVEQRFDPTAKHGPTIVNTAAVSSHYGPSGDWDESQLASADPVGLRVGLYEDRLRVTAYAFGTDGLTKELNHIDVPRPAGSTDTVKPQIEAQMTLNTSTIAQGGKVEVKGTGFIAGEKLSLEFLELDQAAADPAGASDPGARAAITASDEAVPAVAAQSVTADSDGMFTATVAVPAQTPVGLHRIALRRADGAELTQPVSVTAADTIPEIGTDSGIEASPAPGTTPDTKPDAGKGSKPDAGNSTKPDAKSKLAKTGGPDLMFATLLATLGLAAGGVLMSRRRGA